MSRLQQSLETLTRKWWFYLVVSVLFFLPSYSSLPFDPRRTPSLIAAVLSNPLIYSYPPIMPLLASARFVGVGPCRMGRQDYPSF